jgi:hypothetical protein
MVQVLQLFMELKETGQIATQNPIPQFEEHFSTLAVLVMAFEQVARKPSGWAQSIITGWSRELGEVLNDEENDLEQPILRAVEENTHLELMTDVRYRGFTGTMRITTCSELLSMLQRLRLPNLKLPTNATGLGHRLRSSKFREFLYVDCDSPDSPLKRQGDKRPIGILLKDKP